MEHVCRELLAYHRLKEVWGKGRIRINIEPGYILPLPEGNILGLHKHTAIMGRYVHPVYGKTEEFLGYSIEGVLTVPYSSGIKCDFLLTYHLKEISRLPVILAQ